MIKKENLIWIACVILFVILVVLVLCERSNPEGGVALVHSLLGNFVSQ